MAEEANLARAMLELQREGRTGVLEVRGDGVRTVFYLDGGVPVAADHGTPGDTLGRLLLRQGLLTPAEYARALERMLAGPNKRFGEATVDMGVLTADEVEAALAAQLRMKVIHCLGWEWATWTFTSDTERVRSAAWHPTRMEPLVLAAARLTEPWRLAEVLLPAGGKAPLLRGVADAVAARFQLGALGQSLLARLDGDTLTEQLVDTYAADGMPALLAALQLAGELTLRDAPQETQGPEAPQGTAPAPPPVRIPAAPARRRTVLPVVPRSSAAPNRASRARARAVLGRLRASRLPPDVTAPSGEVPPDPRGKALVAAQWFHVGKSLLRANRLAPARAPLQRAAELQPRTSEYALYASWVDLRTAPEDADPRARRVALREAATRAARQVPSLALSHYALGYLARLDGDLVLADSSLRHAQRLDPETLDAERHVRIVRRRAERAPPPAAEAPPPPSAPDAAQAALDATPAPVPAYVPVEARSAPQVSAAPSRRVTAPAASAGAPRADVRAPPSRSQARARAREAAVGLVLGAGAFAAVLIAMSAGRGDRSTALPDPAPTVTSAAAPATIAPAPAPMTAAAAPAARAPTMPPDPVAPTAAAAPSASIATTASIAPSASLAPPTSEPGVAATEGLLRLPDSAKGHRVFVDGRVAGEGSAPLRVLCGTRAVKVGSSGRVQNVDVPCGGEATATD